MPSRQFSVAKHARSPRQFTRISTAVHRDTPRPPHDVHSIVHRPRLTTPETEPNFASQGSLGPGRLPLLGKGGERCRARGLVPQSHGLFARGCVAGVVSQGVVSQGVVSQGVVSQCCPSSVAASSAVRPAIRSGLLPLWRDRDTVQIGIDPRRAVALVGMANAAPVIRLLDGSREREQVIAEASAQGVPPAVTERVLTLLAAAGVLIDFPAGTLRSMPQELRPSLIPALAAASLARLDGDGGARLLARRAATTVHVCGSRGVAATLAGLLTSSGIATLAAAETEPARGERRRSIPPPDLVLLVGRQELSRATELQRRGVPHLAVVAEEAIGIVGPLVRPGTTACLRCLDLSRAQRDPAWPLILAQVTGRAPDPPACDAVLAAAVAAQAAAQAIAFAERAPLADATANGTLELVLPGWQWRRTTWLPHPACTCGGSDALGQPSAAR